LALVVALASSCAKSDDSSDDYTGMYSGFINGLSEPIGFVVDGAEVTKIEFGFHYTDGGGSSVSGSKTETGSWPIEDDRFSISTTFNGLPLVISGEIDPDTGESGGEVLFNGVDSYGWYANS
jgi:hypothetical protein